MIKLKVKLSRSPIGLTDRQRANVHGLGLHRIHQERVLANTPAIRGMIKKVLHMVEVAEVEEEAGC